MSTHTGASTRELIAELARLDDAVRATTPVPDRPDHPPGHASALSPQFLDLLSVQLAVIGELRRRRVEDPAVSRAA